MEFVSAIMRACALVGNGMQDNVQEEQGCYGASSNGVLSVDRIRYACPELWGGCRDPSVKERKFSSFVVPFFPRDYVRESPLFSPGDSPRCACGAEMRGSESNNTVPALPQLNTATRYIPFRQTGGTVIPSQELLHYFQAT